MAASRLTSEGRLLAFALVAFGLIVVFAGWDVWTDLAEGASLAHVLIEVSVIGVGLLGAGVTARRLLAVVHRAREHSNQLERDLQAVSADAERWRSEARELLDGLGAALDTQFDRWQLTTAEREVALLLLKGLSHKEVAEVRKVTEATTRQQARSVYRKAGVGGRHDLAAFFLEDLMLPVSEREA